MSSHTTTTSYPCRTPTVIKERMAKGRALPWLEVVRPKDGKQQRGKGGGGGHHSNTTTATAIDAVVVDHVLKSLNEDAFHELIAMIKA